MTLLQKLEPQGITKTALKMMIYNRLEFILIDLAELCYKEKHDLAKRMGIEFDTKVEKLAGRFFEDKRVFKHIYGPYKSMIFSMLDYKAIMRDMEPDSQVQLGDDADKVMKLLLTSIDRAGINYEYLDAIVRSIEKRSSKVGILS